MIASVLFKVAPPTVNKLLAPVLKPPVAVVKPVTPNVPPTVALLVTCKAVPAELNVLMPVNVLSPAIVWATVLSKPALVPSATARFKVVPVMLAPLAVDVPETAPTLVMPVSQSLYAPFS